MDKQPNLIRDLITRRGCSERILGALRKWYADADLLDISTHCSPQQDQFLEEEAAAYQV